MGTIEFKGLNMSAESFHRAVRIGMARRLMRERGVKNSDDSFEGMTTDEVEKYIDYLESGKTP